MPPLYIEVDTTAFIAFDCTVGNAMLIKRLYIEPSTELKKVIITLLDLDA